MAINKVKYGETTLIDLTGTTATSNTILQGYGAYGKDGVWIDGIAKQNTGMESVTQDQEGFVILDDDEGNQIAVNPLSVTENGTYRAATGSAYNPVTVNVPSPDFIVTLTKNSNDEWEPDCTFAEAKAAYNAGKNIMSYAGIEYITNIAYNEEYDAFFYIVNIVGTDVDSYQYRWSAEGIEPSFYTKYYQTAGATATPSDVLSGKSFYNSTGRQTGTIATKSSSDLTVSGATVTAPAGYYSSAASKSVATGSATTPATTITANPTISVNSSGLITATTSASQSITPTVVAGYVSSGIVGTVNVSGSKTQQLTTKGATTYTPSTTAQTIASGTYLTGTQTISGDSNLVAENIKKDVTIFGVTGTAEAEPSLVARTVTPNLSTQEVTPTKGEIIETLISNSASSFATDSQISSSTTSSTIVTNAPLISGITLEYPLHVRVHFVLSFRVSMDSQVVETLEVDSDATFSGLHETVILGTPPNRYFKNFSIQHIESSGAPLFNIVGNNGLTWGYVTVHPNTQQETDLFGIYVLKNNEETYNGLSKVTVNPIPSLYTNNLDIFNGMLFNDLYVRFGSSGITLGSEITYLGSYAFAHNNLQRIESPYVAAFGEGTFFGCQQLRSVSFPNLLLIGASTFQSCINLPSVSFPNAQTIGAYRFMSCSKLSTISFPNVLSIGSSAFQTCSSLASAIFPLASVIEYYAFYSCKSLSYFSAPLAYSIGSYAFYSCSVLSSIYFPQVSIINAYAFFNTGITQITSNTFSDSYSYIYNYTFYGCSSLSFVSLPNISTIGSYAFNSCSSLQEVYLPQVSSLGTAAFSNCKQLQTFSAPNLVTIGASCFFNASALKSVNFPIATTVMSYAFNSCYSLNTIILGNISSFSMCAFQKCYNLLSLYLMGDSVRIFGNAMFSSTPISTYTTSTGGVYGNIYVPESLYSSYITYTGWSVYSSRFVSLTEAEVSAILNS